MLRSLISKFNDVKYFFSSLDILIDLKNTKPKIVFFSENKIYQKFSEPIINAICLNYTDEIYYLSIDKHDKINNKRVKNYFVNSLLINFIFNNFKAENMFLTTTDLGNNLIKKTKNIDKYIYYFHSPVSTTKNYTSGAFDNYDMIMCIGQFQIDEIRLRESLKKIKKKELIKTGYFYFDYLIKNINHDIDYNEILIAPSWNKNMKDYINENFIELIDVLIKKKCKVIFRPHPEHFKRSKKILDKIKNKFSKESFELDADVDNFKSMQRAKCLITDSSGIAIEYITVMKRPILYFDEHDKIHNTEFQNYSKLITIDQKIKENFGYLFQKKDFDRIEFIISRSEENLLKKLPQLKNFINDNFFHFGDSESFLYPNLKKII
jgi:YidC/Oxa1 family membrane protein insertase